MKIKIQPDPGTRLIMLPEESIENKNIETIEMDGKIYDVHDWYVYHKGKGFPSSLFFLALGRVVDLKRLWNTYSKSEKVYFFVTKLREE